MQINYKELFKNIPEYIIVHRKDGTIIDCNSSAASDIEINCKNIFDIIIEKKSFLENISSLEVNEPKTFGEYSLNLNDGIIRFDLKSVRKEDNGEVYFVTVIRDTTRLKEIEKQFCQAQKQEAIGALTAGMAHDFKNILNNIKIYNSLISNASSMSKIAEYSLVINEIILDAFNFINGILSISKDKADEYEIISVDDAIKPNILLLEKILRKNISFSYINNAYDVRIKVIKSRFSQMVMNICINAAEAIGRKEGDISIVIDKIQMKNINFVQIIITDNGCGVVKTELAKIFDPFYTTKGDKGTGLGLAMVRMAVRDFGGFISVDSVENEWTSFKIYLPEKSA